MSVAGHQPGAMRTGGREYDRVCRGQLVFPAGVCRGKRGFGIERNDVTDLREGNELVGHHKQQGIDIATD